MLTVAEHDNISKSIVPKKFISNNGTEMIKIKPNNKETQQKILYNNLFNEMLQISI